MKSRLNYSGFIIAGVGFVLTRFTVTLAIYEDPLRIYFVGVVPPALGLGLAAFGVSLTVADVEPSMVRTTAMWCVFGAGTMLILVVLTQVGSNADPAVNPTIIRSHSHLSNFLIGGNIGGTLTGLYAARNRRQHAELRQQARWLAVLNHMLRHKILNALTPLRGFATVDSDENQEAQRTLDERTPAIETTVDKVRYFTSRTRLDKARGVPTDLSDCLTEAVETIHDRYLAAHVSVNPIPDGLTVCADDRLSRVFLYLVENAIVHAEDDTPLDRGLPDP